MTPRIQQMKITNRSDGHSLTLQQWIADRSLLTVIKEIENQIKLNPTEFGERWLLFQLLCLIGEWQRALKQLQLCAQMRSEFEQQAHLYRGLIACELFRQECFTGHKRPAFIQTQPSWLNLLLDAIPLDLSGDKLQADEIRLQALSSIADIAGLLNSDKSFLWISDSDTWLGPTIELVIGGIYTWLPFEQIHSITSKPPTNILELLWKPAHLVLKDGSEYHTFLMARCNELDSTDDALLLCQKTIWKEFGQSSVRAYGQKTWQTDQGEIGILEMTKCLIKK